MVKTNDKEIERGVELELEFETTTGSRTAGCARESRQAGKAGKATQVIRHGA